MTQPTLYLSLASNGDQFKKLEPEESLTNPDIAQIAQKANACQNFIDILKFLDFLEAPEQQKLVGRVKLQHSSHPEYPGHTKREVHSWHPCEPKKMRAFVEQRRIDTDPSIPKDAKLTALIFSKSLPEIHRLLRDHAQTRISFWGKREVHFDLLRA